MAKRVVLRKLQVAWYRVGNEYFLEGMTNEIRRFLNEKYPAGVRVYSQSERSYDEWVEEAKNWLKE